MKPYPIIFFALMFTIYANTINAQYYNTGQDRNINKYSEINTEHFRLIFPNFAESKAQYFAHRLQWAWENVPKDMHKKVRKVNIIMYFESATSNAMVIWAPRRMEIHSTPDQQSYAQEWFEQLALHEYRHVVQIDHLNQGITKIIAYIFGEAGTSAILGAYLPLWYLEGDAVATETALSSTGRGRMSDFAMPLKAQLLAYGKYSYDKASMGSYKDFVPNHYILGYHLVTIGREKYGVNFWRNIEDYVARNPYLIVPFSHSIYKQSGLRKKQFYNSCMMELEDKWKQNYSNFSPDTLVKNRNRFYTSYRYGQMLNDSILIAYKSGIGEIGKLVGINLNSSEEEKILTTGYGYFNNIDVQDSNIFWIERRVHPRWEKVNYQVVMRYDFKSKKKTQISHKTNYNFVVKNPTKNEIACISINKRGENSIVLISLDNKIITKTININSQIKNIEYNSKGDKVYLYKLEPKGFALEEININTLKTKQIISPSYVYRNWITATDSSILFISDSTGNSNIYKYNFRNKTITQISDAKYGIGSISTYKNKILYDDYSESGWQINCISKRQSVPNQITQKKPAFYKSYIIDSNINIQSERIDTTKFDISKYHKFSHLINFHSWGPIAVHTSNSNINPGLSIMSQNILSNMDLNMGYEYILNESVNRYFMEINYTALFPRISFTSSYQDRRSTYEKSPDNYVEYTWNETNIGINISQDIRLNKGAFRNYIRPLIGYNYQFLRANDNTPSSFPTASNIQSFSYEIYASTYLNMSNLELNPRLGQNIKVDFRHTPFGNLDFGYIFSTESNTYLPGIGKHHNIKFYFGYQRRASGTSYSYSNIIKLPRGIVNLYGFDIKSYQLNYQFPLLYPDISISSIAYIKRIKANLFVDYAENMTYKSTTSYEIKTDKNSSIGVDLRFDLHILRTIAPLDLGLRSAYLPEDKSSYFQFLFNINL